MKAAMRKVKVKYLKSIKTEDDKSKPRKGALSFCINSYSL